MKFLKKIKIEAQKIFYYFYLFLLFFSFLAIIATGLFLYKKCYQIIPQTNKIMDLKGKAMFESININKFNSVIKKIEEKTSAEKIENINNPFD
jgi:hypothetical protein